MNEKQKKLTFLFICFGLVFLTYCQSLFGDFVLDDRYLVEQQNFLRDVKNFPQLTIAPYWSAESGLYRPTVMLSYALNYYLLGPSPFGFHLINLIFYALTGYLLFSLISKLFPKKKTLAYLTSILFLVLPIHTEAVANIIGRAEIFALFFSLLALVEIAKEKTNFWKTSLWFLLAITSKEVALAVFPIALIILIFKKGKLPDFFLSFFASASLFFTGRFFALWPNNFLGTNTSATLVENPLKFVSFWPRIATSLKILFMYVQKSFLGLDLCSDYSFIQIPVVKNFFNPETILGLFILLFSAASIVVFLKRQPLLALGSAFFLFSFLPISNLIFTTGTIAGDRLMFFPSVGLCIYLVAGMLFLLKHKNKTAIVLTILIVVFYAGASFTRAFDWLSEKRLFTSARYCAPSSVLSRSNFATIYYFEKKYDEAEKENLAANEIYDKYSRGINNLGLVYWQKGEYEKAKEQYFKAIRNWPPYEGVYENIILLYLSQGDKEAAARWTKIIYGK